MKKVLSTLLASTLILGSISTTLAVEPPETATNLSALTRGTAIPEPPPIADDSSTGSSGSTSSGGGTTTPTPGDSNTGSGGSTSSGGGSQNADPFAGTDFLGDVEGDYAVIYDYTGAGGAVTVPDTIGGKPVTVVWLEGNNNITSLVLPSGLIGVATTACDALTTLTITGTELVEGIVTFCDSLDTVYFPSSRNLGFFEVIAPNPTTIYYGGSQADRESKDIAWDGPVTWVYNATMPGTGTPGTSTPTPDTSAPKYDSWAESIVAFSDENGLTVDSLGNDYTQAITRVQIADLLVNMVEKASGTTLPESGESFTDTDSKAVSKAAAASIIGGRGNGKFDPDATATRQEIAIMIVRAIEKLEEISGGSYIDHSLTTVEGYADFGDTATWAQSYVAILANNQIMMGSDGMLNPLSQTKIQECLVLNNNLFQLG